MSVINIFRVFFETNKDDFKESMKNIKYVRGKTKVFQIPHYNIIDGKIRVTECV